MRIGAKHGLLLAALGALALGEPVHGGQGIISVNQHKTYDNSGCGYVPPGPPASCPQDVNPPYLTLGNDSNVLANSFHVGTHCQELQARCNYKALTKPKILSSDIACVNPDNAKLWIQDIVQDTYHGLGAVHFEHFDPCLSLKATKGEPIGGWETIPDQAWCDENMPEGSRWATSSHEMLDWIAGSGAASPLSQNGLLLRSGDKLQWKTGGSAANKRLIGWGFMGGIAAGNRLDPTSYFAALRSKNVNFTRVWAFELWSALAVDRDPGVVVEEGPTPFQGALGDGSLFDLNTPNPVFYRKLREFSQAAADRGVVVTLTAFDKHGLICHQSNRPGRYYSSPFRDANNDPQWFLENIIDGCTCPNSQACSGPVEDPNVSCAPLDSFVRTTPFPEIRPIQVAFLRRVGEEVGGVGNVMYEVINEALKDDDWIHDEDSDGTPDGVEWQLAMAYQLRMSLPLANSTNQYNVSRDAFNGENEISLAGKGSDLAGANWTATNAKVIVASQETGGAGSTRILGYVVGRSEAGQSSMSGSLPFSSTSSWTKVQVRADLSVIADSAGIGFTTACGAKVFASFDAQTQEVGLGTSPCGGSIEMQPQGTPGGTPPEAAWQNVRLKIEQDSDPSIWHVSVFRDDAPVPGLENVTMSSLGSIVNAYFYGKGSSVPYGGLTSARIDNFEAARFCDKTASPFNCQP